MTSTRSRPKGFLTHANDVLSGVIQNLRFSKRLHEQQGAGEMIPILKREIHLLSKRAHEKKRYKREVKRLASPYPYNNAIWHWDT